MKWIDIEQNTPEWERMRLGRITASKVAVIMGVAGKTRQDYALQLALERINKKESINKIKTYHMKRGHEQEAEAIALYEEFYFTKVTNGGFFYDDYSGDSPDGLVGTDGGVEIKSVIASVHLNNIRRGKCDPSYYYQIIAHLEASGRKWFDFVSYCADFPVGKQLFISRINRDDVEKDIELLTQRKADFNVVVNSLVDEIKGYKAG